jgi:hypothetical protein
MTQHEQIANEVIRAFQGNTYMALVDTIKVYEEQIENLKKELQMYKDTFGTPDENGDFVFRNVTIVPADLGNNEILNLKPNDTTGNNSKSAT